MSVVRKCHNESCECNVGGAYCDACEITISESGVCESFCPRIESAGNKDDENNPSA